MYHFKMAKLKIEVILIVVLSACISAAIDPCLNFTLLDDPWRDVNNVLQQVNHHLQNVQCDRLLDNGWYRFKGAEMPFDTCIKPYRCGTHVSIWLKGSRPMQSEGVVLRQGCGKVGDDCCGYTQEIGVQNCGTFMVYYLQKPSGCSFAYCTDKVTFPSLTHAPYLNGPIQTSSGYTFSCLIPYPPTKSDAIFEVTWLLDGAQVTNILPVLTGATKREVTVHGSLLAGHMNKQLSCSVRTMFAGMLLPSPPTKSNGYWIGLKMVPEKVHLTEVSPSSTVNVISTVPIACDPSNGNNCSLDVLLQTISNTTADLSTCAVTLRPTDWNTTTSTVSKPFQVFLKPGYNKRPDRGTEITLSPSPTGVETKYNNETLPVVTGATGGASMCTSTGDPHVITFDHRHVASVIQGVKNFNKVYTFLDVNQYTMAATKDGSFRVDVRTKARKHASVNCGVAMRDGNDVIVIDMCNGNYGQTVPRFEIKLKQLFSGKTRIYKSYSNNTLVVSFPSGAVVKVHTQKNYLDAAIIVPDDFYGQVEGLCGDLDGNPDNDMQLRDGTVIPFIGHPHRPARFTDSWIIPKGSSLFERVEPYTRPLRPDHCACSARDHTCNGNNKVGGTNMMHFCPGCQTQLVPSGSGHSQTTTPTSSQTTPSIVSATPSSGTGPATTPATTTTDYVYPPPVNPSGSTPAPVNITTPTASRICYDKLNEFPSANTCIKDVFMGDITDIMDMCVSDLELTGDKEMALSALTVIMETCALSALRNGSLDPTGLLIPTSTQFACPRSCSGNGNCVDNVCACAPGFEGSDCSVDSRKPPTVDVIYGGNACDMAKGDCFEPVLIGENMKPGETKCQVRNIYIKSDGTKLFESPSHQRSSLGVYLSSYNEKCSVNPDIGNSALVGYIISLTNNNGAQSSKDIHYYIYNSKCLSCDEYGQCNIKNDTCMIDNTCYMPGDASVDHVGTCNPQLNNSTWTHNQHVVLTPSLPDPANYIGVPTGCGCYFDATSTDCACCKNSGCPCPPDNRHSCYDCIHQDMCSKH